MSTVAYTSYVEGAALMLQDVMEDSLAQNAVKLKIHTKREFRLTYHIKFFLNESIIKFIPP